MASRFGWCEDGHHKECPKEYQRFYIGPVGRGRKKKDGIIMLDEVRTCECHCHNPEQPKKTVKKKTRRKK